MGKKENTPSSKKQAEASQHKAYDEKWLEEIEAKSTVAASPLYAPRTSQEKKKYELSEELQRDRKAEAKALKKKLEQERIQEEERKQKALQAEKEKEEKAVKAKADRRKSVTINLEENKIK